MFRRIERLRNSLVLKLILTVELIFLVGISTWAYFNIRYQKEKVMDEIMVGADRLGNTIKLGTHYAMMLNSRDDINQIIQNIGSQKEIENIRIYNKEGQIKFSNRPEEMDRRTNIKDEACYICHQKDPPIATLALEDRTRIFRDETGNRQLGIITPICNEPGCATDACHVHPQGKKILGALDLAISLRKTDRDIRIFQNGIIAFAVSIFLITSAIMSAFMVRFVNRPINRLIDSTRRIARGEYGRPAPVDRRDEIGQLAMAINRMGGEIQDKQAELNQQKDEYQNLFEMVPCFITVQDRNFRLIKYNREFEEHFQPEPGDYCYHAYKGRDEKCENCPVERTFEDAQSHYGEETGRNRDGGVTHWVSKTAPLKNTRGKITTAMEMSLDITPVRQLEAELIRSEKKYHAIFNNIPNPVFVLDTEQLTVIDCNDRVKDVYGYDREGMIGLAFPDLFRNGADRASIARSLRNSQTMDKARHSTRDGKPIYVNLRLSPSEYSGRQVLLVTASDITKRLDAEGQLIQASKLATLGEMATGVAHELNQPLSVIKTASSFCLLKFNRNETIAEELMIRMLRKVDSNVDRATRIIQHMRQFARKSDLQLARVQVEAVMEKACEFFSQQLKVRGIEVDWDMEPDLPPVRVDAARLEQVFINLLINARDAIEDRRESFAHAENGQGAAPDRRIFLRARRETDQVRIEVADTGDGIPPEAVDKVFEPFFTTKEVGKGTGLGLSISYGIIRDCGGSIEATSEPDGGACFIIRFPAAPPEDNENGRNGDLLKEKLIAEPQVPPPLTGGGQEGGEKC